MVDMNGAPIKTITHNGSVVKTWVHNGVEIYSASEPWIAYEKSGNQMVANSPAAVPSVHGVLSDLSIYLLWQVKGFDPNTSISSNNVDGTKYLPTNGCKYMDVVVRCDYNYTSICTITGKINGVETVIREITVPKYSDNTNYVVEGIEYSKYTHLINGVDVSNYESVKIICKSIVYAECYIGLGYTKFYN